MRRIVFAASIALAASPAFAKKPAAKSGKDGKSAAATRVLIFDPGDPKARPTFYYDIAAPERVSAAPIMFTTNLTTEPEKDATGASDLGSGSDAEVSVTEKTMMLDQAKTESPADSGASTKAKGKGAKAKAPKKDP